MSSVHERQNGPEKTRGFVHLHVHSHYSLLEALPQIDALVSAAKADKQTALALTDNGNLYGAIDFYKTCTKEDIKPIIGVDFYVAARTRHDKEHGVDDESSRLVLLAKDLNGYQNLLKLVSRSHIEGFFHTPRVDRELLEIYRDHLVAIIPSINGEVARALKNGQTAKAREILAWHKKLYGEDCYIEISHHPEIEGHESLMKKVSELGREMSVPLVAAHDVSYLQPEDALACELVNKIRTGGRLDRETESSLPDHSFITQAQARILFKNEPDILENTLAIAAKCNLVFPSLGKAIFPVFPIPEGTDDNTMLRKLTESGIAMRDIADTPELRQRVDYELGLIKQKGYASYFLIVADLLGHARDVGILTNTRGSAAGSMVSYLCGITTVDPMAFNMPFERFLNPERPSAPDIDMDIADNRRDELVDYTRKKYGEDHVVQIGTFGTMLARAAVRDVSRALAHSYGFGDKIAKLIPFPKQGFPVFIKPSIDSIPELAEIYKADGDAREVLDLAMKIEGNARHVGVHAAGVIIAPDVVTTFSPIQLDPKGGKTISQYDMYSITDEYGGVGLLKFDFLGLTNLSVLADSVQRVHIRLGITIDLNKISLDDKKVYEMLTRGETLGVFQLASSGMTAYLKELKPSVVHDLNAMVALYRPGPIAFIPDYIARKNNPSLVAYLDPRLEDILKPTYGILIYQDDVMMIAVQLAGYSWGEADKFRKAMGKKIPEEMAKQKERFISGCIERGMKPAIANELWNQIETFAAYGFNKSHAASYGNLAYKTAYMKANYPLDYMAALLTADAGDVEKIAEAVAECKKMGINILAPSVNESQGTFTVLSDAIRFGLYAIKNFGAGVADSIVTARKDGPFTSIADFLSRIPNKNLNKKSLESLIKCGGLDEVAPLGGRGQLLANIDLLLAYHREHISAPADQHSLFGVATHQAADIKLPEAPNAPIAERLAWEKELLGIYISGHPLEQHRTVLLRQKSNIRDGKKNFPRNVDTVIGGFVESVRIILTKNGERMAFARLADFSDTIEVVFFPRTLKESNGVVAAGTCIAVKGKYSDRNGDASFTAEQVKKL